MFLFRSHWSYFVMLISFHKLLLCSYGISLSLWKSQTYLCLCDFSHCLLFLILLDWIQLTIVSLSQIRFSLRFSKLYLHDHFFSRTIVFKTLFLNSMPVWNQGSQCFLTVLPWSWCFSASKLSGRQTAAGSGSTVYLHHASHLHGVVETMQAALHQTLPQMASLPKSIFSFPNCQEDWSSGTLRSW